MTARRRCRTSKDLDRCPSSTATFIR
jgi:hypothetical protein